MKDAILLVIDQNHLLGGAASHKNHRQKKYVKANRDQIKIINDPHNRHFIHFLSYERLDELHSARNVTTRLTLLFTHIKMNSISFEVRLHTSKRST